MNFEEKRTLQRIPETFKVFEEQNKIVYQLLVFVERFAYEVLRDQRGRPSKRQRDDLKRELTELRIRLEQLHNGVNHGQAANR